MKIYTKSGDKGMTSLFGGQRVSKYDIRVEAYGNVDELNAYIGLLFDLIDDNMIKNDLLKVQNELFVLGGMLATPENKETKRKAKTQLQVSEEQIHYLEDQIDKMNRVLPPMTHFILPSGHPVVSHCHIVRNVCRRAERRTVQLADSEPVSEYVIQYLNRLSDYLFVLARKLTKDLRVKENLWNV